MWAMQDTLLDRIRTYADLTNFAPANRNEHEVFFHAYEVYASSPRYSMRLKESVGSDLEGVAKANAARLEIEDHVLDDLTQLPQQAERQTRGFRIPL